MNDFFYLYEFDQIDIIVLRNTLSGPHLSGYSVVYLFEMCPI